MTEESDRERVVRSLQDQNYYLENVKKGYLQAQDAIPYLQDEIDRTNLRLRIYQNMPPEGDGISLIFTPQKAEDENQYLKNTYVPVSIPSFSVLTTTASFTTSGSSDAYADLVNLGNIGTPQAIQFRETYKTEYRKMQAAQERPKQVRDLLSKVISQDIIQRFDEANKAFQGYKARSVKRTAAGNEMRNLLHGLKGDLWNMARHHPKENMNWSTMAARLAVNGGTGSEHIKLAQQEQKHSELLSNLASILKDYEGKTPFDLEDIWTQVIDLLFVILGLLA